MHKDLEELANGTRTASCYNTYNEKNHRWNLQLGTYWEGVVYKPYISSSVITVAEREKLPSIFPVQLRMMSVAAAGRSIAFELQMPDEASWRRLWSKNKESSVWTELLDKIDEAAATAASSDRNSPAKYSCVGSNNNVGSIISSSNNVISSSLSIVRTPSGSTSDNGIVQKAAGSGQSTKDGSDSEMSNGSDTDASTTIDSSSSEMIEASDREDSDSMQFSSSQSTDGTDGSITLGESDTEEE